MKILIFGLNYYPELTGTGKYTGEMANWFAEKGHIVDVIASHPHYPQWIIEKSYKNKGFFKERINNVNIFRVPLFVPNPNKITTKNRILMELSYSLNSLRYWLPVLFRKSKYDIVIAVSPPMQVGFMPYIYNLVRKVPWIFHIQDLQVDAAVRLNMLKQGKLTKLLYYTEKKFLEKATVVSSITNAMLKRIEVKNVTKEKLWMFPNWSDIDFITPTDNSNNNKFRDLLGISKEKHLFVYSGNIGEKQGLEIIIDAAEKLQSNPKLHFLVVGEGAAKNRLLEVAKRKKINNINFMNIQPLEDLPELLAAADVHLIIQKSEAADLVMPSKLTNILAAGRPVIATAESETGLYEIVTNNDIGRVGKPGDLEILMKNILELSQETSLRNKMGVNSRIFAEAHLDKENVLKEFESKIKNLLN